MDLDQYRETSHALWEAMARGWESRRDWVWQASRPVGEWLVERLDIEPGQTVLELAAGTGDTGFAAAARLRAEGRLVSTDFAEEMVSAARRRAAELGVSNAEFRVMDAERMDLADGSVDGVLCRWGYMLMADPAAALRETRRVLRPGGRLACSTWAGPERNQWSSVAGAVLVERGHLPPPEPGQPGPFAIGTPERLRELLTGAGFERVEVEEMPVAWTFDGLDDYWEFLTSMAGSFATTVEQLPAEEQEEIRSELARRQARYESGGRYSMDGVCLNAVAA